VLDSGVDVGIPETGMQNSDAFAVVIGNRDYRDANVPDVEFALNDALIMKDYLVKVFGYKTGNSLYQENATSGEMRDLFGTDRTDGKLHNLVKAGKSDVFVYYSGHGAPHPGTNQPYFVPVDCGISPTSLENNGYAVDLLYRKLSELPAPSVTLVVDACFSGVSDASPVGIQIDDPARLLENGVVFTSSAKNEISSWHTDSKHGLFTYVFLRTVRDMIARGESTIRAGDVARDVSDGTEGVPYLARSLFNGRLQTPQFKGDERRVLVRVR